MTPSGHAAARGQVLRIQAAARTDPKQNGRERADAAHYGLLQQAAHQLSDAHQRRDPSEHSRQRRGRELSEQSEALQRRQFRIRRLGPRRSMRHRAWPEWQDGDVRGPEAWYRTRRS